MSYKSYEKAIELAKECKYYTVMDGKTENDITKSESLLGIKFSKQSLSFYKKLGYLSFFGNEIFGIDPNDTDILEGNSVSYALNDRKRYGLPKEWLPIYNFDDGYIGYLDYGNLNEEKEPRVIMAIYTGEKYEIVEVIAEDFGDFLLQMVEEQLAHQ